MNRTIVAVLAAAFIVIVGTVAGLLYFGQSPVRDANNMAAEIDAMKMPQPPAAEGSNPPAADGTAPGAGAPLSLAGRELVVVSWGGAYTKSQVEAYHKPFEAKTGVKIKSVDYNGGIAEVKTQVDAGNQFWDVVDMEIADAQRACDEGLLETIDPASLPAAPDGTPATADFIPNGLTKCAVTSIVFGHIVAFNKDKFPAKAPSKLADFFDVAGFPGKRGLRKTSPKVNMELALRADGVPGDQVYAVLGTPEGQARAFAKLDSIRKDVVWWEAGSQPPLLLADGEVAMTTAYNGRIFDAQVVEKKPFEIIWDGQIHELDVFTIVKGAKNKDVALEFLKFATDTQRLADQARWIAYGPARKSSMALIGNHATANVPMSPHMPNAPENSGNAIQIDFQWWGDHQEELNQRWAAWLAKS